MHASHSGTALHLATGGGHLGTIIRALLKDDIYGPDLTNHDVKLSKAKVLDFKFNGRWQ